MLSLFYTLNVIPKEASQFWRNFPPSFRRGLGKKLIKDVEHTQLLWQPLKGYLLVREEKANRSLSEEIERKKIKNNSS